MSKNRPAAAGTEPSMPGGGEIEGGDGYGTLHEYRTGSRTLPAQYYLKLHTTGTGTGTGNGAGSPLVIR